ncbi:class I SAM-dependent methyltransferase [Candidatus Giovannonibacteria bacterium]|nr:class I SAM-dependent methyltransferase [Candidatus Giovannonibacteria bacterium]
MADFLNPESVIDTWDVRPGEKIADFGCGAGYFSIPLGKRVGHSGKVYALDIRQEALEATRAKVKLFHMFNVEVVRADLEAINGSTIRNMWVDKVLIANILFQAENKKQLIEEAFRILRPGGKIILVEWEEGQGPAGPSTDHKIGKSEAQEMLISSGFVAYKEFAAGSHHYGLIYIKPEK